MKERTLIGSYAAIFAVYAGLVLFFKYPPLLDYPNHLARMHIIAHQDSAFLVEYYAIQFQVLTNLGMDIFIPVFDIFLPLSWAGKLYLLLGLASLTTAPLFLSRQFHGRITTLSLAGSLIAFNEAFLLGFSNFTLSAGLALFAFGAYVRMGETWRLRTVGLGAVMAVGIFVIHIYGFAVYAICIGSFYIAKHGLGRPVELAKHALQFVPASVLLAIFVIQSMGAAPATVDAAMALNDGTVSLPDRSILASIWVLGRDVIMRSISQYGEFAPLMVVFALCVIALWARRTLWPMSREYLLPFGALLYISLFLPSFLFGAANVNWRFIVPTLLFLVGVSREPVRTALGRYTLLGAIVILSCIQTLQVATRFFDANERQLHVVKIAQALPEGAKLFAVFPSGGWRDAEVPVPYSHMASLAVIERNVLLPSLFAYSTQQPLSYQPKYQGLPFRTVYPGFFGLDLNHVEASFDYVMVFDHDGDTGSWRGRLPFPTTVLDDSHENILLLQIERPSPR